MKAIFEVMNPSLIDLEIRIRMTLNDWVRVAEDLKDARHPGSELNSIIIHSVRELEMKYESTYEQKPYERAVRLEKK